VTKLTYEKHGKTAILTINRPQAMNAYDAETIREMGDRFLAFDSDPELRVAILTGAGDKAFCAGADLKSLHGQSFAGPDALAPGTLYSYGPWCTVGILS
jgi:enoyl-CoA hydratase/carnithine racemase